MNRLTLSGRALAPLLPMLALLLVSLIGADALGCPACAGREDGGPALFSIYATMVVAPFFAVAIAWRSIRSLNPSSSPRQRGTQP